MLSVFPSLLDYGLLGPTILRVFLGIVLVTSGMWLFKESQKTGIPNRARTTVIAIVESVSGILIFFGVYTQIGALCASLIALTGMIQPSLRSLFAHNDVSYYALLLGGSLALLILGPGAFSFDLPL